MSILRDRLRLQLFLLFNILTVVTPHWAYSEMKCADLFKSSKVDSTGAYYTGRFSDTQKPSQAPKFKNPPRIILSRFAGHNSFQSTTYQAWDFNGERFIPAKAGERLVIGSSAQENILAEMQDFSLGKMIETDYITPDQAEMFRNLGTGLQTAQINFLEVVHPATQEEIRQFYPRFPDKRVGSEVNYGENTVPIKTAALWTVGGQVAGENGQVRRLALPWEKEDARKGQSLDRTKYKFVWEWGRAAQDVPGEIFSLLSTATLLNYLELRALGGRIEDAYFMVHSFDKVNTRYYSRMHPNTMYPKGWTNMEDVLFLIPLKEAIEKYRPRAVSEQVAQIVQLSNGKMDDLKAIDLLIDNKLLRWNELDYQTSRVHQPAPIIIQDLSVGRIHIILKMLKTAGLNKEEAEKVLDFLFDIKPLLHSSNFNGKYQNAADSLLTAFEYQRRNGVEISNLDPNIARYEKTYVQSVLMSAATQYLHQVVFWIQKLYPTMSLQEAFGRAAIEMEQWKMTFGVTTSFPEVENQLRLLNPRAVIPVAKTQTQGPLNPNDEIFKMRPYYFRDSKIYLFDFSQIQQLVRSNPDLYRQLGEGLKPGVWRSQYLLSQPDLF